MNKKIFTLTLGLLTGLAATAQVNLANFDFNGGTSYPISAATTTTNVTASVNGSETNAAYSGTVTSTSAFVQNTTAGSSISMGADDNTNNWVLTLSGSNLSQYMNYKIYFQAEHSPTGAVSIGLSWSTNGSTYTALSQTIAPGANVYADALVDLSSITQLNNATTVYIKFNPSGASAGGGTLRLDNLQIQAALSPWTMSGGNVNFTGGITATSFTTTGDAKINGNLTAGGLTSNSSSLNVTTPVVLSNTLKNTTLAGTGSRLLLTDATGLISPLAAGTSSQVLFGNGTWAALPASTFTTSGSNAYFTGGNLGIGTNNPAFPLDVTGNARVGGVLSASTLSVSGGASFDSLGVKNRLNFNGGQTGISYIPDTSTNKNNILFFGSNSQASSFKNGVPGTSPFCTALPISGSNNVFLNNITLWNGLSPLVSYPGGQTAKYLDFSFSSIGASIDLGSGTNSDILLLNSVCGKNVGICTNGGQVGIGTSTPMSGSVLDVANPNNYRTFFLTQANGGSYNSLIKTGDNALIWDDNTGGYPNNNSGGFVIASWDNTSPTTGIRIGSRGNLNIPELISNASTLSTAGINPQGPYQPLLVDANGMLVSNAQITGGTSIGESWVLGGNHTTNSQAIGTIDAGEDLPFVTANTERMRITSAGNIALANIPSTTNYSQLLIKSTDQNHGLGYFDAVAGSGFGGTPIDGPVLYGYSSGALGINQTSNGGTKRVVLKWDANGAITINANSINQSGQPADAFLIQDAQNNNKVNFKVKTGGQVWAREVIVSLSDFPDYVFSKDYKLTPLSEVKRYTEQFQHLPNMPSANDVEKNGANLGEIQRVSVEKIEELYKYVFQLESELKALKEEIKKNKSN